MLNSCSVVIFFSCFHLVEMLMNVTCSCFSVFVPLLFLLLSDSSSVSFPSIWKLSDIGERKNKTTKCNLAHTNSLYLMFISCGLCLEAV